MQSPLESFMNTLHKRRTKFEGPQSRNFSHTSSPIPAPDAEVECELTLPDAQRETPVSSLPAHTHTSDGFPNTGAEMKCETKCEGSLTLQQGLIQPGSLITWDHGGPAEVDFVHTDEDGSVWIFVSWPGGWSSVNANVVTKVVAV
jgi:hypothetical protein